MLKPSHIIPALPPSLDLETVPVLKTLARANRALAELKGRAATIPNQGILINTLALQEAKASSEIENIVTTQDELFQADLQLEAIAKTAKTTLALVKGMRDQMASVKKRLREDLPSLYSQDLLNNLFRHPYTRI